MEVNGVIKVLGNVQAPSEKFKKRELVVTTDEQYPQHVLIEFVQNNTDLLNKFKVGDEVKVHINLGGREWINPQGEAKYFNSVKGWRIEKLATAPNQEHAPVAVAELEEEPDDLPF